MNGNTPFRNSLSKLLEEIGENPNREGLQDTPRRFAHAWKEMTSGYGEESKLAEMCTTFEGENYDEMIVVKNIEFYSLCEHHLLPIIGSATVGYIPAKKLLAFQNSSNCRNVRSALTKSRTPDHANCRYAFGSASAKGVAVRISATHLCMTMRGVRKRNSVMETSAVRGIFEKIHEHEPNFWDRK